VDARFLSLLFLSLATDSFAVCFFVEETFFFLPLDASGVSLELVEVWAKLATRVRKAGDRLINKMMEIIILNKLFNNLFLESGSGIIDTPMVFLGIYIE